MGRVRQLAAVRLNRDGEIAENFASHSRTEADEWHNFFGTSFCKHVGWPGSWAEDRDFTSNI